jgi:hypothetical protein
MSSCERPAKLAAPVSISARSGLAAFSCQHFSLQGHRLFVSLTISPLMRSTSAHNAGQPPAFGWRLTG